MINGFLALSRFRKQLIAGAVDLICFPLLFTVALLLHFDTLSLAAAYDYRWIALSTSAVAIPVLVRLGIYRAVIRYIDQKIITAIVTGVSVATVVVAVLVGSGAPVPLSATPFLIFWFLSVLYLLSTRFAARRLLLGQRKGSRSVRVAIYGAGEAGNLLANAVAPGKEYEPVFFIDDNPERWNTTVRGIPVYRAEALESLAKRHNISAVLLAMPSISRQQQRRILDRLALLSLKIKVTPSINSIVKGKNRVEDVRQIEIEDLLSRDVVAPNPQLLRACISGKAVMVSGAGGSIGSELCRQIMALSPTRLILLDSSEYSLYAIEQELRELQASEDYEVELVAFVGSVLETEKCTRIMRSFAVQTVYHAAAYKHVPLVEHNPIQGIRNNAFGTLSLGNAAIAAGVECFVLISTDKAVRPTNVMGATKRLAELILQALARRETGTRFSMVRFGNVLGSSGSVVPLFRKQIAAGGPITLTHPDITRYFMTIPEAAQLVVQAGAMGKGGDVFVLDMGEPVKIADLAARMVHLAGQEVRNADKPDGNIEIKYVGLRPGEKLYEELLIGNNVTGTEHPLIRRAQEAEIAWPFLEIMLTELDSACARFDQKAIRALLTKIVSEYQPSSEIVDHLWSRHAPPLAELPGERPKNWTHVERRNANNVRAVHARDA